MFKNSGTALASLFALGFLFVIYAVLVAPAAAPFTDQEQRYLIKNVRVLDVNAGSFGSPVSVSIANGRITTIGVRLAARNSKVVDGGGGFLVPGFWDMHTHSFQTSPQLHFPLFVANGITNVRDMMDCPEAADSLIACVVDKRRWSAKVDAGQDSFEHARLLLEQCFMSATAWRTGKLDELSPTLLVERMVRDHVPELCQSQVATMREANVWFAPTHVTREDDARASDEAFLNDPRLDYLDPLSRWAYSDDQGATVARYLGNRGKRALQAYFAKGLELTGEAHRAKLNILVGTDSAIGGFRYHDEMAHLVKAGLSPADTLRAATLEAARYANLDSESGSIEIGKRADLILLTADPLVDIGNTKK